VPARSPFRSPLYWAAFAAGLGWTILFWTRAAPLASALDDEIGHFLIARDTWTHPELLLNAWGRVGTTASFVLPAAGGLGVARAAALAMSAGTVLVTTQLARLVGVRALALVPVLLWFQPWFHQYANAVLTEVPFTLALMAGCWAALAGRESLASALFGLLPLMRHEGIAVLGLWGLFLVVRRRWRPLAPAAVPVLAYQGAFSLVLSKAPFAMYLQGGMRGIYGHGGWLHYVLPLGRSIGPVVALLAVLGVVVHCRDRRLLLLAAPFVGLVLVETVIYRYGLFGSGGNADYLLPVAAFAAVAAALGADRLIGAVAARSTGVVPRRPAVAPAALAAVLALGTAAYALRTRPAHADLAARPMKQAVHYLDAHRLDPHHATATHVWFFELSGAAIPKGDGLHSPWSRPPRPRHLALRSIVVWDCFYSNRFGLKWRALTTAGFTQLRRFGGGRVVVLERAHRSGIARARPPCRY
jgi:hypothetical protein